MTSSLTDRVPPREEADPDRLYDEMTGWAEEIGLSLYPHQDEALIELLSGNNVILATPTGSGKSLVATGAHFAALATDRVSFYTAPIKALVSEKFFALCEVFGADDVGMMTGDASVNADAPIICCTAEVLANLALREGERADVGLVVMDEFHYYAEPDRGWAWQVPLLELPQAQFLLMSATLGPVDRFVEELTRRNGRETSVVDDAERPVPLTFSWALTPVDETVEELVATRQVPAYVVHFTQAAAVEHATRLLATKAVTRVDKERIAAVVGDFRFGAGFGRTLSKLVRNGVGVHHAGMLPRYRRLVEQLAQQGLLTVICGTDTLGVGINVPIRTVLFTGLAKFDGSRQRILRAREFHQIAGRAGRAGFDTVGYVVVQAPEHVIENERMLAKAGDDPKKRRKVQRKKPPEGAVVWTEQTYEKLVHAGPEPLVSRMKVDNAMVVNVVARPTDAFPVMRRLLTDNHEDRRKQLQLARRALRLTRSLLRSGVLTRLEQPDLHGRRIVLTVDLPPYFALNQPLAHFALATLDVLDPEHPDHTLDMVSVVEAVLEPPRQVLYAQQFVARGEAVAEMKAEGIEYDERMALLEEVTWPQPLAELLAATYEVYRQTHPWLPEDALAPKSIVREMYEQGMTFTDFVGRYQLARSEGLVLRYLTDAYRTLRHTVPDAHRTPELDELVEWLGETVRQTDSSLLDEWEALADPEHAVERHHELEEGPRPPRRLSQLERVLRVMVRNAVFRRVALVARDDVGGLAAVEETSAALVDPPRQVVMDRDAWDAALEEYYAEHASVGTGPDARGPELFQVTADGRCWRVRQTLDDPAGHRDWVLEAEVDLDATDEAGEAVVLTTALRRL
jgi:superfamily II RNA helicase